MKNTFFEVLINI